MNALLKTPRYIWNKRSTSCVVSLASTSNCIVVFMMNCVDSEHRRSTSPGPSKRDSLSMFYTFCEASHTSQFPRPPENVVVPPTMY